MLESINYDLPYDQINFRDHPEMYRVGRGEQGVLLVEPYKSEILPFWRFRTPEIAQVSAQKIYALFLAYKKEGDFVGMDMARKFLQMGFTRARRYANHPDGQKWNADHTEVLPQAEDAVTSDKAEAARIFYSYYERAKTDPHYIVMKARHRQLYER